MVQVLFYNILRNNIEKMDNNGILVVRREENEKNRKKYFIMVFICVFLFEYFYNALNIMGGSIFYYSDSAAQSCNKQEFTRKI